MDFSAPPVFTAHVDRLDFSAGAGSFWPGAATDTFAARYTGDFELATAGAYTFHFKGDDGSALTVDGGQVLLNDGIEAAVAASVTLDLAVGAHTTEVRYVQTPRQTALEIDFAGPGFALTAFAPGLTASAGITLAVSACDDAFSLAEDARDVPLAVLLNDITQAGGAHSVGPALHGAVRVVDGLPVFTAASDFTGADRFTHTFTPPGAQPSSTTVNLCIRPSHAQPQTIMEPRIAPKIRPSGLTLEIARQAFIGLDGGGVTLTMNTFAAFEDRQFVGSVGRTGPTTGPPSTNSSKTPTEPARPASFSTSTSRCAWPHAAISIIPKRPVAACAA